MGLAMTKLLGVQHEAPTDKRDQGAQRYTQGFETKQKCVAREVSTSGGRRQGEQEERITCQGTMVHAVDNNGNFWMWGDSIYGSGDETDRDALYEDY